MLKNHKGVALMIVLSFIFLTMILSAAAVMLATGHFGTSFHQIERARAMYTAEAGMEQALRRLRQGVYPAGPFPIADAVTINYLLRSYTANIQIFAPGSNPTGLPGETAPPGCNPIIITVDY